MGNFYGRDGNNVDAFSGTLNNGTGSFNNLVVVPYTVTPLPAAAWLLGSGLMGLIGIRRKNGK
ncbi:MAG: VPLPA-CTERM sorting domain-containing protein [Geobacteraceae bacterium]